MLGGSNVEESDEPFDAAEDGDDPETDKGLLVRKHVVGEG